MAENLYSEVVEVDERVILARSDCELDTKTLPLMDTITGDKVEPFTNDCSR